MSSNPIILTISNLILRLISLFLDIRIFSNSQRQQNYLQMHCTFRRFYWLLKKFNTKYASFSRKTYPFGSFEVIVIAWVHKESLLFISGRFRWSKSRGSRNTEQLTITFEQLAWTSDLFIIFNIECCFFEFSKNFKNVRKGELRTFLFHNFKIKFIII